MRGSATSIAWISTTKSLRRLSVKFKDLEAIVTSRLSYNVLPFDYRADVFKMTEAGVAGSDHRTDRLSVPDL